MEQARELAQQFMGGRGEQGAEGGERPATGAPLMAMAERFMGGGQEHEQPVEEQNIKAPAQGSIGGIMGAAQQYFSGEHKGAETEPAAGAPLLGMAQQYLGGSHTEAEGGGLQGQLMGAAAKAFLGGGGASTGEGAVAAATPEGAGKMDAGLVDKLLTMFQHTEGKQFEGGEGEYDKLAGMAQQMLGTPIGRDLLEGWVKQRLGM